MTSVDRIELPVRVLEIPVLPLHYAEKWPDRQDSNLRLTA